MGALKGSISVRRYTVLDKLPDDARRKLLKGIRAHLFTPIDPRSELDRSVGWVSMLDSENVDLQPNDLFAVAEGGEQLRLSLRIDVLKPSGADVRRQVNTRALALEAKEGRPLSKRERRELKAVVIAELRLRTPPRVRVVDVVWNLDTRRIYFWSQVKSVNEGFLDLFVRSFGMKLEVEGPSRWAQAAVGKKLLAGLEPTAELRFGFEGVRPLNQVWQEDE
jgi:DNA recombination-dependent growth factor C